MAFICTRSHKVLSLVCYIAQLSRVHIEDIELKRPLAPINHFLLCEISIYGWVCDCQAFVVDFFFHTGTFDAMYKCNFSLYYFACCDRNVFFRPSWRKLSTHLYVWLVSGTIGGSVVGVFFYWIEDLSADEGGCLWRYVTLAIQK
jgi:hypothetical protein